MFNKSYLVALAAGFLIWGSACTTTQAPETQIDDLTITTNIKTKLASEQVQTLTNIEVNTTNGVVTLAGQVQNEDVRRRAEQVARAVQGVRQVNNNLQVQPAQP